jgi:hypothetical protein
MIILMREDLIPNPPAHLLWLKRDCNNDIVKRLRDISPNYILSASNGYRVRLGSGMIMYLNGHNELTLSIEHVMTYRDGSICGITTSFPFHEGLYLIPYLMKNNCRLRLFEQ